MSCLLHILSSRPFLHPLFILLHQHRCIRPYAINCLLPWWAKHCPPGMPPSSTADCAPGSLLPPTASAPIVTFSCFRNHVAGLSLLRCLRSLVCSLPMTLPSAPPRSLPPTVTLGHSATTLPPNSRFQGCHSLTTTCCVPDHSLLWP